jgi:hypothetical protein
VVWMVLAALVAGLLLGVGRTVRRMLDYQQRNIKLPELIWRDLYVIGGLATTALMMLVARILIKHGVPEFRSEGWWLLVASAPSLFAVWVYAYYEFFRIERNSEKERFGGD